MSTAAVLLVKDEADILGWTLEHLAGQVDAIYLADNGSTDGTEDVIDDFLTKVIDGVYGEDLWFSAQKDDEVGYFQSRKTTELAMQALADGHSWVVPCDADEWWYATDGRRIADFVAGLAPDVQIVTAPLYNHVPTALDPPASCDACDSTGLLSRGDGIHCEVCLGAVTPSPYERIGWRKREHGALPKVAARLRPDLVIEAGNHGASTQGTALRSSGFVVRHFSWRSPEQYCNPPEAPIWMADYSFKRLGDVAVGDDVIGFGRIEGRSKVAFVPSRVLAISEREAEIVRVDFASGRSLRCTPDHLWWQPHYRFSPPVYKTAKVGRSLGHVIEPSFAAEGQDAWLAGWLAGIYDGEGHDQQIAQSQTHNPDLYERICAALDHFGFAYTRAPDRIHFTGGRDAYVRFMNLLGPTRRTGWRERSLLGGAVGGRISTPDRVVSIQPDGRGEVISMTTTSGNYVAWGYASKNCRKIRNGERAYAATDLPSTTGEHWRMWEGVPDEALVEHFRTWFWSADPTRDDTLIYDPAP